MASLSPPQSPPASNESAPRPASPFRNPLSNLTAPKLDKPSFIPAWRRPTHSLTGVHTAGRRPSVQFVPHTKDSSGVQSRSSSARPSLARKSSYNRPGHVSGRRLSSPPPPKQFSPRVSFDTFSNPAASDFSLTLSRKHVNYEYTKRSRTFLVGTDTNEYSDTALEWLIDELVDDGDEIVCLRVVEKDSKEALKWAGGQGEKGYRAEANRFLEAIQAKNADDKAINLVLEFSIGRVQDTIQQMIRIYEPAILVVGTRGRSLTGYQSLLSSGSVSKYCLQYSPVPVIVVRPSSKREAKKQKRLQDPSRTGYRDILDKSEDAPRGRGGHLLDERNRSRVRGTDLGALGELSGPGDPDEEARAVAAAIGYRPERSDGATAAGRASSLTRVTSAQSNASVRSTESLLSPNDRVLKSPDLDSPTPSDEEPDEEEAPGEEEVGRVVENIRPEDEAAMLAYERAYALMEEELREAEERARREKLRAERSASRSRRKGGGASGDGEEDGGAAVLDLLAQLDRGIK